MKELTNAYLCWKERPFLKDKLILVLNEQDAKLWLSMQTDSIFSWHSIQSAKDYNLSRLRE